MEEDLPSRRKGMANRGVRGTRDTWGRANILVPHAGGVARLTHKNNKSPLTLEHNYMLKIIIVYLKF